MRALPVVFLLACGADDGRGGGRGADVVDDVSCATGGPDLVLLTRALDFVRPDDAGTSLGFDLDGYATASGQPEGCGVEDYVGPDGATGIDNAMASLLPVLATTEAVVLEDLMQASINNGSLLLMLELQDLDDPADDACVDLGVFQGAGVPLVGADGWLLPNQTVDQSADAPFTVTAGGSVVDGVFEIGPAATVPLRVTVLDLDATFDLNNVHLRLERGGDDVWRGVIGGGVKAADLMYIATLANVDPVVAELIEPTLAFISDLEPDETGRCTQLSVQMNIEAVPAFLYE